SCTRPPAQLRVVKTPDNGTFTVGGPVTFQIVRTEEHTSERQSRRDVAWRHQLPKNGGLVFTTATTTQGTCSPIVGNLLNCSLNTIPAGGSVTVTVATAATTPATACQSHPNPAAAATAYALFPTRRSSDLSCTRPPAQLRVVKTPDNGTFTVGGPVTFQIV